MRQFEVINGDQVVKDLVDNPDFQNALPFEIKLPKRATKYSAGYDIYTPFDFVLNPGKSIKVPTGIKVKMPENEFLAVFPRSGHGFKFFVRLANTVGIVDSDYYGNPDNDGHIWVKARNEGDKVFQVKKGDAIAQGIFLEYKLTVDDVVESDRVGGLGSTN